MTEDEWLLSDDAEAMLRTLKGCAVASERKLRLFAYTCAVLAVKDLPNREGYQGILAVAEKLAEGNVAPDEVRTADAEGVALQLGANRLGMRLAGAVTCTLENDAYRGACGVVSDLLRYEHEDAGDTRAVPFSHLLRCVFGNPYRGLSVGFRPVTLNPAWQSETAVALAAGIYAERAFDRMPILADALEESGCDNPDILNHCRGDGPHVRGCWVVDLVLGKQ